MEKHDEYFTSNIRLKIIKPFLSGEKKLKELEKEYDVSYATLKRWVKSYKEKGEDGLVRKENKNKFSYKKLNEKALSFIKEVYFSKSHLSISDIYHETFDKLASLNCAISYSTFYRIIQNLDEFMHQFSLEYITKKEGKNSIFIVREFYLDSFFLDKKTDRLRSPLLSLVFESKTLEILSFSLTFNKDDTAPLFSSIREAIIRNSKDDKLVLPEAIFIISTSRNKILEKKSFKDIPIHFSEENFKIDEIEKFIFLLSKDIKSSFLEKSLNKLKTYLFTYLFLAEIDLDKKNIDILDIFLLKTKRDIYRGTLRFKNNIYFISPLKKVIEKNIVIRYNPLDNKEIYLFYQDERIALKEIQEA